MNNERCEFLSDGSSSAARRAKGRRTLLPVRALAVLACLSASVVFAEPFSYVHVLGTDDLTPKDPNQPAITTGPRIAACDIGMLTDSGFMSNVCSFDGDANSDGGVFYAPDGEPYRSFRREDPLPGHLVGFEKSVIPFGFPALHPTTGDTYVTVFFDRIPDKEPKKDGGFTNRPGGRQEGVYVYRRKSMVMQRIADTTVGSPPPPDKDALWTDFSTNVFVSEAGAFFVGDYRVKEDGKAGQGIYRYVDGSLEKVVGNHESTEVSGQATTFARLRAVTANASTVLFVGESQPCIVEVCSKGVYAYDLSKKMLSTVIESGAEATDGGTFLDFAVEPEKGIFHNSIATNDTGDIVMVASYKLNEETYQGVFLLKNLDGKYATSLILGSGGPKSGLLMSEIDSFNTVAINSRGDISFTVANTEGNTPEQGLVFYRNETESLHSVFKEGDQFLAALKHPGIKASYYGGLVAGSQALNSEPVTRIFFRHAYVIEGKVYSMMVLATLDEP